MDRIFIDGNSNAKITWVFQEKGSYTYDKTICEYVPRETFLTFTQSGYQVKKRSFKLLNFRDKTAVRAEVALIHKLRLLFHDDDVSLSRPLHDCLFQVYYDLGLDLGYVPDPTRELR